MIRLAAAGVLLLAGTTTLIAQRPQPTPDQRLDRLERQVQQVQRQLFPKGRPADTAGLSDDPAASQSSVIQLDQRLDSLERQLADIQRLAEENGNRMRTLQTDLSTSRADQDRRITTLEGRLADALANRAPAPAEPTPAISAPNEKPKPQPAGSNPPSAAAPSATSAGDGAGEAAYTEGFKLWESGDYDGALKSLRAFVAAYPKHRRASYASNLIGRSLLDKGEPQAAVQAFLANYRANPGGERAPDSLYFMGQALMKLDRRTQACNAYSELSAVYGSSLRADLKKALAEASATAKCS